MLDPDKSPKLFLNHLQEKIQQDIKLNYTDSLKIFNKIEDLAFNKSYIKPVLMDKLKDLIKSTNIAVPAPADADPQRAFSVLFICFNPEVRSIVAPLSNGGIEISQFSTFARQFKPGSFFPFILDANEPGRIYLGIGSNAQYRTGQAIDPAHKLLRNGGHYELASRYRGSLNPDMNGLFGVGLSLGEDGEYEIELRSVQ